MATKTWKIGEYCKGGIITVEIKGKVISIVGKDWDTSAGYTKKSNQSNAKEFYRRSVSSEEAQAEYKLMDFLEDLTTYYYASEVVKWIKTKVELKGRFDW